MSKFFEKLLEQCGVLEPAIHRQQKKIYSSDFKKYGITYNDLWQILIEVKRCLLSEIGYARKQGTPTLSIRYIEETLALKISASKGDERFVMFLLHYGVDPNRRDIWGNVPLWHAMRGKHEKIIKLLIDNGANLFSGDIGQFACTAARGNDLDLLKEMVLYGADVTLPKDVRLPSIEGDTALEVALNLKNEEIIQFLLDQGADGPPGQTASEYMKKKHLQLIGWVLKNVKIAPEEEKTVCCTSKCCRPPLSPVPVGAFKVGSCTRVTISCLQSDNAPKLVVLPQSLEQLLKLSISKFGVVATRVLTENRAEVDDISLIRDGDHLILTQ